MTRYVSSGKSLHIHEEEDVAGHGVKDTEKLQSIDESLLQGLGPHEFVGFGSLVNEEFGLLRLQPFLLVNGASFRLGRVGRGRELCHRGLGRGSGSLVLRQ